MAKQKELNEFLAVSKQTRENDQWRVYEALKKEEREAARSPSEISATVLKVPIK